MPSPTPTPTPTPVFEPEEQVFIHATFSEDPRSHDFNADPRCGGVRSMWAGLLTTDASFNLVPDWCRDWAPHNDGTQWHFSIRRNMRGWSNGDPVTAHDFVWSLQRILDPQTATPDAWYLFDIVNAAEIHAGNLPPDALGARAVDDWRLEIDLVGPRSYFPAIVASSLLLPAHRPTVEEFGDEWTEDGNCVSNGAFALESWRRDERIELVRNDYYWNTREFEIDRVEAPIMSASRALSHYLRDEVDYAPVDDGELERARTDAALNDTLYYGLPTTIWMLVPRMDIAPLDAIPVRRAIGHAIDRRRLVQIVEGRVSEARSLIPHGMFPANRGPAPVFVQQFDVDRAWEWLAGTAYEDPANWPELAITLPSSNPYAEIVVRDVTDQIRENLGVNIGVNVVDLVEYDAGLREHRHQISWVEWEYRYPDPNAAYGDLFGSDRNPFRPLAWTDANYDELVRLAAQLLEVEDRSEVYRRCEELLQEQVVYWPLAFPVEHVLVKPWVRHLPRNIAGRFVQFDSLYDRFLRDIRIAGRPQPSQ
jgi:oligopeptide transport system substrate-binding protein